MATEQSRSAIPFYNELMEEIKLRIETLISILKQADMGAAPRQMLEEFGYLQLRMICELTATGCLVAHGDIAGASGLKGEYAADKIMNALEKLHPAFFPKAVKSEVLKTYANGRRHLHLTTVTKGMLSKTDVIALYRKCGDALHVGSLKKLGASKEKGDDIPYIAEQGRRFAQTLNYHSLVLLGARTVYLCALMHPDHGNRVHTMISQAIDELPSGYT